MKTTHLRAARIGSSGTVFFVCFVETFGACIRHDEKPCTSRYFFFRNRVLEIILSHLQGISMYYPSGVVYNLGLLTHFAAYGIFVLKNETRKIVKIYKFSSLILRVKMS